MENTLRLLVPLSVELLAEPHSAVLDVIGVDAESLIETSLYAWSLRDNPDMLYDELCTQMFDESNSLEFDMVMREHFDSYHLAVTDVIEKIRPYILKLDEAAPNNPIDQDGVEYIKYCGGEEEERLSFFIAELHYPQ